MTEAGPSEVVAELTWWVAPDRWTSAEAWLDARVPADDSCVHEGDPIRVETAWELPGHSLEDARREVLALLASDPPPGRLGELYLSDDSRSVVVELGDVSGATGPEA